MTTAELAKVCRDKIAAHQFSWPATITLVLPGKRLAGRSGPIGEHVADLEDGKYLVAFECQKILDWMKRKGLT